MCTVPIHQNKEVSGIPQSDAFLSERSPAFSPEEQPGGVNYPIRMAKGYSLGFIDKSTVFNLFIDGSNEELTDGQRKGVKYKMVNRGL